MKLRLLLYLLLVFSLCTSLSVQSTAFAQSTCFSLNNGGQTSRQVCTNATPAPQASNATQSTAPQQTKGGLPIYPASDTKSTPNTGPEAWSILVLISMAIAGIYLRKKTKLI